MKIYLTNPPSGVKISALSIGLASLAAVLKKENHEVKVIDFITRRDNVDKRIGGVIKDEPQVIGINIRSDTISSANELASIFKKRLKHILIVGGGPGVSIQGSNFFETTINSLKMSSFT